jgi:small ligand-binding sensory domain FIST
MSDRVSSGYLFGGLAASRSGAVHVADGAWRGGLSGVAFTRDVALISRVTQGSQPLGPVRRITAAERNLVLALDGEPALPCLLRDLGLADLSTPRTALNKLHATLVALADADAVMLGRPGQFGPDTRVRHLVGLDPARDAVAVVGKEDSDGATSCKTLGRPSAAARAPHLLPAVAAGRAAASAGADLARSRAGPGRRVPRPLSSMGAQDPSRSGWVRKGASPDPLQRPRIGRLCWNTDRSTDP